ncbi:unnamed protein product, partial [Ixodes hexagonus]
KVQDAYNDLDSADAKSAVKEFWHFKLRHYGLLNFPVHDSLVTDRATIVNYDLLFKRLRSLQELNRAGKANQPGYLILGVGLFSPRSGKAYDYLKELL